MASKKGKTGSQFLWGDDESGTKTRTSGTNLSGNRFSTRDYAVDQSVNLMAMGEQGTDLSASDTGSQSGFSVAGLFRGGPEGQATFDEYGDAAPSTESEEYISDKRRRMTPVGASIMTACGELKSRVTLTMALCLLGVILLSGGIVMVVNMSGGGSSEKEVKHFVDDAGVTPNSVFEDSGANPQKRALKWIVHEDPAKMKVDDEGFLDRYALAVFYFGSNDKLEGWNNNEKWMTGAGICSWAGVECSPRAQTPTEENDFQSVTRSYDADEAVTGLILKSNKMDGTLPSEFAGLSELMVVDLSDNDISGSVPPAFGKAPKLRDLLLRKNSIFGTFPTALTDSSTLRQLDFGENKMEGAVPDSISKLIDLHSLSISSNLFVGEFPNVQSMTKLMNLFLDENEFQGTIPSWIDTFSQLKNVRLSKNKFSGTIPSSVGKLKNLETLHLDGNKLEGTLPDMFDFTHELYDLQVQRNKLSGHIPNSVYHLQALKHLLLDNNKFSGSVSANVGLLRDVITISLAVNDLTGSLPKSFVNLDDLTHLTLNNNKLTGMIPTEIGHCWRLETLRLDQNKFAGSIPSELGSLANLEELRIEMNSISGQYIPFEVCHLTTNEVLSHLTADCTNKMKCDCCSKCY